MKTIRAGVLVAGLALTTVGCATSEDWAEWKNHPTHFASGSHGWFSVRNRDGATKRVMRTDVAAARDEGWWGRPISVDQREIVEN